MIPSYPTIERINTLDELQEQDELLLVIRHPGFTPQLVHGFYFPLDPQTKNSNQINLTDALQVPHCYDLKHHQDVLLKHIRGMQDLRYERKESVAADITGFPKSSKFQLYKVLSDYMIDSYDRSQAIDHKTRYQN